MSHTCRTPLLLSPLVVQQLAGQSRSPPKPGTSQQPGRTLPTTFSEQWTPSMQVTSTPPGPGTSQYRQVRAAEILLPAYGRSNDIARIRNNGRPLQTREMPRASSLPAFPSEPTPSAPRMRAAPGALRAVSQVVINYPHVDPRSLEGKKRQQSQYHPDVNLKMRQKPKELTWDELPASELELQAAASPQGPPSDALRRSMRLLQRLGEMRRLAAQRRAQPQRLPGTEESGLLDCDGDVPVAEDGLSPTAGQQQQDQAEDMCRATLRNLEDSVASLEETAEQMAAQQEIVALMGGARHATNLLSQRVLSVIRRKLEVLSSVELRTAQIEAAHAQREKIIADIVADEGYASPPELLDVRKFISSRVHRPCDPVDADRSNFEMFAASFKLPARHASLEHLRSLADDFGDWWAKTACSEAQAGAEYATIKALTVLAVNVGASEDHPMLLRAAVILHDRLAAKVLREAEEAQARDALGAQKAEARGDVPVLGLASKAADTIEQAILKAVAEGVPAGDPRMKQAGEIVKALREADGQRKRMMNRQKRLAEGGKC